MVPSCAVKPGCHAHLKSNASKFTPAQKLLKAFDEFSENLKKRIKLNKLKPLRKRT